MILRHIEVQKMDSKTQLNLPCMNEKVCLADIRYYPEILVLSLEIELYEKLTDIMIYRCMPIEAFNTQVVKFYIDWLKRYTDENRFNIVIRAVQVAIEKLAEKIKKQFPGRTVLYQPSKLKCEYSTVAGPTRDCLVISIELCDKCYE